MVDNPIPGVTPTEPPKPYGPDKPGLGSDEQTGEKSFTLGPEGGQATQAQAPTQRPSPMEVAGDASRQQAPMAPEELSDQISKLHHQLSTIQQNLQNTSLTKNFTSDHYDAMQKVVQKINPDLQTIAKNSNGKFEPPQQQAGQSLLGHVSNWISGAQGTLGGALDYLQHTDKPDIASYLRLQYAVQRATQRGELFSSIIGSSVSGIKTIMSTQLG